MILGSKEVGIITGALDEINRMENSFKAKEQGGEFVLTNAPICDANGSNHELAQMWIHCRFRLMHKLWSFENFMPKPRVFLGEQTLNFFVALYRNVSIFERSFIPVIELRLGNEQSYGVSAISFHKMMQVAGKERRDEWVGFLWLLYRCSAEFSHSYWYGWCQRHC